MARSGLSAVLLLGLATGLAAQDPAVLVDMRDLSTHELRNAGFVLSSAQRVRVEATGARQGRSSWFARAVEETVWPGNAWILDARTREVVWELRRADTRGGRKNLERYEGSLQLSAGEYEVYYASFTSLAPVNGLNLSWLISRVKGAERDDGLAESFALTIRGIGQRMSLREVEQLRQRTHAQSIVRLTSAQRGQMSHIGFELERPVPVDIYAVGELSEDQGFDYGWIIDANTLEKVWTFDYHDSQPAGGARKNRQTRASRTLPAGRYAAVFALDDSHDPREWNSLPPYDPANWGLTVNVKPEDRSAVHNFVFDPTPDDQVIASLTRMRDRETRSVGFTLTKPMAVRVYALGEGSDGELNDYGWLIDAGTRRRVWNMSYERTDHAGGAQKNRRANEIIQLEPGSYLLYFRTDDSHAFRSWNAAAPFEGEDWGISLFPANGTLDRSVLAPFNPLGENSAALIARITNVGDDETRSRTFTLSADSDVRIYALGEGSGEMFDYAWIENPRTGRRVWEMSYRLTEHAGGAQKNRLYNGVIRLPAGEYVLRYQTDGSHSPDSWNAEPPFDPAMWGVVLYLRKR